MAISITELEKAIITLEESLDLNSEATPGSKQQRAFRDACIQRFEYGVELSWKVSLKKLGSSSSAARPAVREMARAGLIDNTQVWFDFIDARNNSSHSYDEDLANKVFEQAKMLPEEAKKLLARIKKL